MKRPVISCDYSRLPGALLPAMTFMAAAALLHTAAFSISGESMRTIASALAAVPALALFVFLFGPVFRVRSMPESGNGAGGHTEGEHRKRFLLRVSAVLAVLTAAPALNILLALLVPQAFVTRTERGALPVAAAVLASCLVAPLCEELVFRCHLYPVLQRLLGDTAGIVISSLLFGLYHEELIQGIYAACMGMLLCLAYRALGGLPGAFSVHAAANLLMIVLSVSGAFAYMVRPAYLVSLTGCAAVSISTHFYLRRVLHL